MNAAEIIDWLTVPVAAFVLGWMVGTTVGVVRLHRRMMALRS